MTKPLSSRRAKEIAADISDGMGLPMKSVTSARCTRWYVDCRSAIAQALAAEGYSQTEIGLVIKRDPSTVNYMLRGRKRHV